MCTCIMCFPLNYLRWKYYITWSFITSVLIIVEKLCSYYVFRPPRNCGPEHVNSILTMFITILDLLLDCVTPTICYQLSIFSFLPSDYFFNFVSPSLIVFLAYIILTTNLKFIFVHSLAGWSIECLIMCVWLHWGCHFNKFKKP